MKKIFIALILVPGLFNHSGAQTVDTTAYQFSLQQALSFAYTHQADVLNAKLDEKAAKHTVNEFKGIGLPQINGSIEFTDYVQLPTSFFPDFISPSIYGILYN